MYVSSHSTTAEKDEEKEKKTRKTENQTKKTDRRVELMMEHHTYIKGKKRESFHNVWVCVWWCIEWWRPGYEKQDDAVDSYMQIAKEKFEQ